MARVTGLEAKGRTTEMLSHNISAQQFDLVIRNSTFFRGDRAINILTEYSISYNFYSGQNVILLAIFVRSGTIIRLNNYGRKN